MLWGFQHVHVLLYFLALKVGLFPVYRFPVVFCLTEFDLRSTVYISNQAFYAGVDLFDDFEYM